ncbi:hypothetical protein [Zhihengliuella flava]|uniref:Uncharacterized BrkB/YihY/UPF0761 family membrane protein n=1 Tax=Zhihengliuella flava TaxID=1285193 RepID=A0A931GE45_9MICC|nr:hypothetical protein [Zhihengliuella flava]MBG6084078.1 uncharacterized BrkB/YihY/UPF0761 family membrane protein [Zhihengliuella flava]
MTVPEQVPTVVVAERKGASITSLVLGLVSILLGFTILIPMVGLAFGILGLVQEPAGRGPALAGVILNSLTMIAWILLIIIFLPFLIMALIYGIAPNESVPA